ncbi:glycosyltransferase family 4 protein [Frateuria flava]|nr:glycosyltransferase family 4 protein [Frateuria flava]
MDVRPRILIVSRNLPPLIGGMERLNHHLVLELSNRADLEIVGPPGCRTSMPLGVSVREAGSSSLRGYLMGAARQTLYAALGQRFDWVLAGSGLVAPLALMAARLRRSKCAVYLHGLDIVVRHPTYQRVWLPLIRRFDLCLANSRNTAVLAAQAGIPADRIRVLHPGVELESELTADAATNWRARHGLQERPVMLSVGRLTPRKGLLEFVQSVLPVIVGRHPKAVLVVIGNEAPDALAGRAEGITAQIRSTAEKLGLASNLIFLGMCDQAELNAAYQGSDVLVFPVRQMAGDVEGFGMVAVEAAAHGVPTVAFSVGGVSDAVEPGVSGWLVEPGDYAAFAERTLDALSPARSVRPDGCRRFARQFAWPVFGEQLWELLGGTATV